jgi:formylmethanofuran dehydrogenase subunit A
MLTEFRSGRLYDPTAGWRGEVRDLFVRNGRFVEPPPGTVADRVVDLSGHVVMAGAIDLHTHIGGGKVALAKMLLPEQMRAHAIRGGVDGFLPTAAITGHRYAAMGYSACFEPAIIACNARQAHAEMADIPLIDTGGYCLLGNDDGLLRMIGANVEQALINDYVAWMVTATQCLAVKVVNAGGISAFKFNQRKLDVDTPHPTYGVTPADVIRVLARAVYEIGLRHPLHVHCSNLGVAGNIESTLKTIEAADGLPIHLTHVQFHSYGSAGPHGFSSAAEQIAGVLRKQPNVTIDVGQVMFGQTVTISADTMHQFASRKHAKPRKSILVDIECEGGCGVVPFRYRKRRFVNALQWAIGLELFLMVDDPSRVFLTTDHPNGGPFTTYPHLLRLLGDRSFRETALAEIHPDAAAASQLSGLDRQYGLHEVAIMTRSAPARILGLSDMGRLTPGAIADLTVYREQDDWEKMFAEPAWFYRQGEAVVRDGSVVGAATTRTLTARPRFDPETPKRLSVYLGEGADGNRDFHRLWIDDEEMVDTIGTSLSVVPTAPSRLCQGRGSDEH